MGKPRIDPRLRAEFKEIARSLVLRDRQKKKQGRSQNTIGEIERALIQAFEFGRDFDEYLPLPAPGPDAALAWEEIPPRSRQTLDDMVSQVPGYETEKPIGLRAVDVDGVERWARVYASGYVDRHPIHPGGVNPLRKLSVLEPSAEDPELLVLSARGRATCDAYLARCTERDPRLPRARLRA